MLSVEGGIDLNQVEAFRAVEPGVGQDKGHRKPDGGTGAARGASGRAAGGFVLPVELHSHLS
jgi:hypothetical protein